MRRIEKNFRYKIGRDKYLSNGTKIAGRRGDEIVMLVQGGIVVIWKREREKEKRSREKIDKE